MRVNTFAESVDDLPPPPYTPSDSTNTGGATPVSQNVGAQPAQASLRGGYLPPSLPSDAPYENTNFPSAVNYFEERQISLPNSDLGFDLIEHNITFSPETTRDDLFFPSPIETYIDRDVTSRDWSTFVNYLFPALDHSANEKVGNEKGFIPRAFVEEDTPERRQRIRSVVAEWNAKFFGPRLIRINATFTSDGARSISPHAATSSNRPAPIGYKPNLPATLYRSHSFSSTSSSSSSSSSSVDSIKSKDLEGAEINTLRSALLAFRLDLDKKSHLRQSVRQLRNEFRSQRREMPRNERKELRKEYKDQRKDLKREVKAIVKEAKTARKADRKLRKAERKYRRHNKRAETRGVDRITRTEHRSQKKVERAEEKALRVQARNAEARERIAERDARTRARGAEGYERTREAPRQRRRQASDSASSCERGVADAQPTTNRDNTQPPIAAAAAANEQAQKAVDEAYITSRNHTDAAHRQARSAEQQARSTAAAARAQARETEAQARAHSNSAREKARLTEQQARSDAAASVQRALETARTYSTRDYSTAGADAIARARETAQYHQSRPYGADAVARAQEVAGRDYGRDGRERARVAEERARGRVEEVTRGL
ncbi:hypothetical protein ACLMJK_007262 [Lecanora helva]